MATIGEGFMIRWDDPNDAEPCYLVTHRGLWGCRHEGTVFASGEEATTVLARRRPPSRGVVRVEHVSVADLAREREQFRREEGPRPSNPRRDRLWNERHRDEKALLYWSQRKASEDGKTFGHASAETLEGLAKARARVAAWQEADAADKRSRGER